MSFKVVHRTKFNPRYLALYPCTVSLMKDKLKSLNFTTIIKEEPVLSYKGASSDTGKEITFWVIFAQYENGAVSIRWVGDNQQDTVISDAMKITSHKDIFTKISKLVGDVTNWIKTDQTLTHIHS